MTQEKLTYLISCTLPSGSVIHGRIKLYLIWIFFRALYGLYSNIFAFTVVGLTSYPYLIKEGRKMLSFSGAALFLGCEIMVKCSEAGERSNFPATSRGPEFVDLQWRQLGICIFLRTAVLLMLQVPGPYSWDRQVWTSGKTSCGLSAVFIALARSQGCSCPHRLQLL